MEPDAPTVVVDDDDDDDDEDEDEDENENEWRRNNDRTGFITLVGMVRPRHLIVVDVVVVDIGLDGGGLWRRRDRDRFAAILVVVIVEEN